MFEFDYCYLICINANTRYLYVQVVKSLIERKGKKYVAGTKNLKTAKCYEKDIE